MARTELEEPTIETHIVAETWNPIVGEVLAGRVGVRKIGPIFDVETGKWEIGKKSNTLIIRELSKKLMQVTQKNNPANSDIVVNVYKEDGHIEVKCNITIIKRNMNLGDIAEIAKHEDTGLLNLYFTRKGDPDFLISSISVDPTILLRSGSLKYRLPEEITKYADLENISIFTRPVFHSYSLVVSNKLVKTDKYLNKKRVLQTCDKQDNSHLTFVRKGNVLRISSFLDRNNHRHLNKPAIPFLVCDKHIDIPVGMFIIETSELFDRDNVDVRIDFDWPTNPLIVYRGNDLVVSYLGDTYDTINKH